MAKSTINLALPMTEQQVFQIFLKIHYSGMTKTAKA
jgi:hypothetical protein